MILWESSWSMWKRVRGEREVVGEERIEVNEEHRKSWTGGWRVSGGTEEKILGNGRRPRVNLDFKGLVRYKGYIYIYIKYIKRNSLDPSRRVIGRLWWSTNKLGPLFLDKFSTLRRGGQFRAGRIERSLFALVVSFHVQVRHEVSSGFKVS